MTTNQNVPQDIFFSAILFDVESCLIKALQDDRLKSYEWCTILAALIFHLEHIAEEYAPVLRRFAALALTSKRTPRLQEREAGITRVLTEKQYQVALMPQAPDAADHALFQEAQNLAGNNKIRTVVLATNDAESPFPELLDVLARSGKNVLVAVHDYVPARTKARADITPLLISGGLVRTLDERRIASYSKRRKNKAEEELDFYTLLASPEQTVPRQHRERFRIMRDIVSILEPVLSSSVQKFRTFASMMKLLRMNREAFSDPKPSEADIKSVLQGLLRYTDVFEKTPQQYQLSKASPLLEKITRGDTDEANQK